MPNLNRETFTKEATRIESLGHNPVNPFDLCDGSETWEQAMVKDIRALLTCEAISMLPGWENSRGAVIEKLIAEAMVILVYM